MCFAYSSQNLVVKFRVAAFKNILFQDATFFDDLAHTPGKLITRLASDAPNIKAIIDSRMLAITYSFMTITVSMGLAFAYSWQVATLGGSMLLAVAVGEIYISFRIMQTNAAIAKQDETGRVAVEIFENVKTIQLLTLETHFIEVYSDALKDQQKLIQQKCILESANNCLLMSFEPLMYAVCYGLGIHVISEGIHSAADVFQ